MVSKVKPSICQNAEESVDSTVIRIIYIDAGRE
jgi:hypothetical protein